VKKNFLESVAYVKNVSTFGVSKRFGNTKTTTMNIEELTQNTTYEHACYGAVIFTGTKGRVKNDGTNLYYRSAKFKYAHNDRFVWVSFSECLTNDGHNIGEYVNSLISN
jgi:hypothetical protein